MSIARRIALALAVVATSAAATARAADFALKDGDRVVFYGDSITDQRQYTVYTEAYALTRFPDRVITFIHSGWGGDRVNGGGGGPIDVRLDRDVIAYRPTVVTVMLGMNDASYQPFKEEIFKTYREGYQHLVERLKREVPGVRLTLIRPSPYDDVTREPSIGDGYNKVLVRYGEFVEELARKEGATVADLNAPVVEALKKARELDEKEARNLIFDRVHPGHAVQLLMAEALLKAWDAPATVTAVVIDAEGKTVAKAEKTRIDGLEVDSKKLTWTQDDEALPMPIDLRDGQIALAVKSSDVMKALNQETLQVKGLGEGDYVLKVDGQEVGTFSRKDLGEGINLAEHDTPMARQARDVLGLTRRHNDLHFVRWRMVQVPLQDDGLRSYSTAIDALDALEGDLVSKQRAAAKPKQRRFELAPKS
ncbi:MAG TPA: SGNH/GDSL hydrolase family protein [Isosphaeraceae bacterium]|jgi:lysophospholipase L1-like esterase|nr:SGNH/GDSL hydrolase family protein [Isosphaeraceae bacterium]